MAAYVLIINGVARSGKDTFLDAIEKHPNDINVFRFSTIDQVKEIAKQMGCDPEIKNDKNRKLWSDIKMLWSDYNDGIFKSIVCDIDRLLDQPKAYNTELITIICREPVEIQKFVNYFGSKICKTVIVERPGVTIPNNTGDMGVSDYAYDFRIQNDGDIEKLERTAYEFLGALTYKK